MWLGVMLTPEAFKGIYYAFVIGDDVVIFLFSLTLIICLFLPNLKCYVFYSLIVPYFYIL